jgi:two-component system OmpR family sensor kinase
MKSLRRGLTVWLWAALGIVGGLSLAVGHWLAHEETQAQLDYQMQQVAQILAAQVFAPGAPGGPVVESNLSPSIHINHDQDDDLIVTVRNANGTLLYASSSNQQLPGGLLPDLDTLGFRTLKLGESPYRVFAARSRELHIQVAQSMEEIREAENNIALATLLPIAILLPVLAAVLGLVIRRQLRPLDEATATIAKRPPLSLDLLPEEQIPAEIQPLVEEINRLLRRLRTAVEREQRFVTDAAHALRTPLTALQLQAEILDGSGDVQEKAARLNELRAGIRRIIRLSEQLLSLARSESESGPITVSSDLDSALAEVVAFYQAAAHAREVDLQIEGISGARVFGNARRLTLIFGNLLDNALRYTSPGGHVRIRATTLDAQARVEVWDEGPGLSPQDLERVFERFYRGAAELGTGSGLGLATVRTLVDQLGGSVMLDNRQDHHGLVATVTLPLAAQTAADPGIPRSLPGSPPGPAAPPDPTTQPAHRHAGNLTSMAQSAGTWRPPGADRSQ